MRLTVFSEIRKAAKIARASENPIAEMKRVTRKGIMTVTGGIIRRKPNTTMLLVHGGRAGSTVAGNLLDKQDKIYWDGEVLTKAYMLGPKVSGELLSQRESWRKYLSKRSKRACGLAYGFELKPNQFLELDPLVNEHIEWLNNDFPNLNVFFLFRKNLLRNLISIKQGMSMKSWHSGKPSSMAVELNIEHVFNSGISLVGWISRQIEHRETVRNAFLEAGVPNRTLFFEEDILKDPNQAARIIYESTGRAYVGDPKKIRKTVYTPLKELIVNYDEVHACLSATDYAFMLND